MAYCYPPQNLILTNFKETGILTFKAVAQLPTGTIFGEKGLDENVPRTATVVCAEDCHFGEMLKGDYTALLKDISKYFAVYLSTPNLFMLESLRRSRNSLCISKCSKRQSEPLFALGLVMTSSN